MDLTKRQQEIFDFIKRYSAKYGYPPTVRDIGKAVGLASSSTVHAHLANLEKIGLLRRDPSKPRAIEMLDKAAAGVRSLVRPGLPLVGQVAGGEPMLDELLVGVWEGLTAHRAVECPVCGGDMRPEYGAQALPVGGRCDDCGSTVR